MTARSTTYLLTLLACSSLACTHSNLDANDDGSGGTRPFSGAAWNLEGAWVGTTSQGRAVEFSVESKRITRFFAGWECGATTGDSTLTGAFPIKDGRFSVVVSFLDWDLFGEFTAESAAEGTMVRYDCINTLTHEPLEIAWQAAPAPESDGGAAGASGNDGSAGGAGRVGSGGTASAGGNGGSGGTMNAAGAGSDAGEGGAVAEGGAAGDGSSGGEGGAG